MATFIADHSPYSKLIIEGRTFNPNPPTSCPASLTLADYTEMEGDIDEISLGNTAFSPLRHLTIGDYAFKSVRKFSILNRHSIQTLTIGKYAFTRYKLSPKELSNRQFRIQNCGFERIQIGSMSFVDFSDITLVNLNGLKELIIGETYQYSANFFFAKNVVLEGTLIVINDD